jgi:hypothetical protein
MHSRSSIHNAELQEGSGDDSDHIVVKFFQPIRVFATFTRFGRSAKIDVDFEVRTILTHERALPRSRDPSLRREDRQ